MNKHWLSAAAMSALLAGCSSVPHGSIPVIDAGTPLSSGVGASVSSPQPTAPAAAPSAQDSGVVVMIPQDAAAQPIQSGEPAATSGALVFNEPPVAIDQPIYQPAAVTPATGSAGLAADEQLDGPVLALLTTAQQLQGSGDLNGAASSLERAQRIAPREPQVLYRLAEVRLAQGDAAQAEQFARRGLTLASGRPSLQAGLWELIAQARERQGDAAGAAQARQQARVSS